ncbi:MAG: DUF1579 domain-containing protein [Phycisphaerae bacterium]|nr:DUF1579 domain-containing protein [Phycisphaerae bacterium]
MTRLSNIVSACVGGAVAGSLLIALGLAPNQGSTGKGGSNPADPPRPPAKKDSVPPPQVPGKPGEIPMPPEMAAAMEFMQPCPEHEWLAKRAGTWKVTGKMWMAPEMPPTEIVGTSTYRMILGNRYLVEDVKSTMMGEPFEAMGVTGYNRATNKFQFAWMDTMGTAITGGTGIRSGDGKTLTSTMTTFDPMKGKDVTMRSVETEQDENTITMEMFAPGPTGAEMKMMELTYRRSK